MQNPNDGENDISGKNDKIGMDGRNGTKPTPLCTFMTRKPDMGKKGLERHDRRALEPRATIGGEATSTAWSVHRERPPDHAGSHQRMPIILLEMQESVQQGSGHDV